ncbi:ABC transporter substrate-binding protein [Roseateles sp. SL47]|uniref:TAXI family TRAP transporter solute-binding subunit n=1 Tax=Roseateles sp. SL47 TaxID=2995138 RepID=UPI00226E8EB0|nr:TAXI family TRAP transporter solute-binding subunit [Roseateles sp. SL47]WAC75688.1 ABC transporter substrate-binding protein [Roseateles sp. SL47]
MTPIQHWHATRSLRLLLQTLRDMLVSMGPLLLLGGGLLVAAYWWLDPQPPRQVRLATGPAGSAYANFGEGYAKALARERIKVELIASEGAQDDLAHLRAGTADVGFVRGGMVDPVADTEAGIVSLGSLFYEPIWIFYRRDLPIARRQRGGELQSLTQLRGLRVNVDQDGSGVPQIVEKLMVLNGLKPADWRLSNLAPEAAGAALREGRLDAAVLISAPQASLIRSLLRDPAVALMAFEQNEAYSRLLPFLSTVTLPRGVVDLASDLPPHDVPLLATTTALLSREQTHPALRQLFAQAAQGQHSDAGWFNGVRDFPNTRTSELPVSPEGDRAINGTPPAWARYLPFWAGNLLERMWLVVGGLLVLMLPLSRVVPPLYTFRVRSRVFRWYARLREVEAKLETGSGEHDALLDELDELDRVTHRIAVPLSYAEELYALRNNIYAVRKRLLVQKPRQTDGPDPTPKSDL